jgi:hypothetical protein
MKMRAHLLGGNNILIEMRQFVILTVIIETVVPFPERKIELKYKI